MTEYAKLIDGRLCPAPREIRKDGYRVFNPTPGLLRELGYKPVVCDPVPEPGVAETVEEAFSGEGVPGKAVSGEGAEGAATGAVAAAAVSYRPVYIEEAECIRCVWEAYTPEPEPAPAYEERVEALIRERYSVSDELAILRQRDTKPAEFEEYFRYAEACKAQVAKRYVRPCSM